MKIRESLSIVDCVQKWGNATSIALLDPLCAIFSTPNNDGIIGYKIASRCAVVFGDPVCDAKDMPGLIHDFHAFCYLHNKQVIYLAISECFKQWAMQTHCRIAIGFGDEIILNPQRDPCASKGKNASSLRNKYSFSMKQGITVSEYKGGDTDLEQSIEELAQKWLQGRKGLQMCLLHVDMFAHRTNKRWFYAHYKGQIVGVMMLNRLDAQAGWVMNLLVLAHDAPTTTSEFLLMRTLDVLRAEGCSVMTIGPSPGVQLGTIDGLARFTTWLTRKIYAFAKKICKLGNRQRYWKKFHPQMQPLYIVSSGRLGFGQIFAIMKALNLHK